MLCEVAPAKNWSTRIIPRGTRRDICILVIRFGVAFASGEPFPPAIWPPGRASRRFLNSRHLSSPRDNARASSPFLSPAFAAPLGRRERGRVVPVARRLCCYLPKYGQEKKFGSSPVPRQGRPCPRRERPPSSSSYGAATTMTNRGTSRTWERSQQQQHQQCIDHVRHPIRSGSELVKNLAREHG
ncbi:hypothetical protein PVAP13_1KG414005 [Panicum virgatum]|uniref:Uncharacterized protein n=1 Tax=Panicum virgatum TaxID=38727 RepID=A0A8T0XFH4_PANVG|nr:hypothetical protein PVAP13_1KG414005 [Panicum virgatum]